MRRLCKNCESFAVDAASGVMRCERRDMELTETDNPPIDSDCWKRRPKLSGEALSLARSAAGMRGGRPAGYGKGRAPTKQASLRLLDHTVLMAYAQMKKLPFAEVVHRVCSSLIQQYPDLKPEGWVD